MFQGFKVRTFSSRFKISRHKLLGCQESIKLVNSWWTIATPNWGKFPIEIGVRLLKIFEPPPTEWSISPKNWPLWQSKSLIELKNFRIPILIPLVQSKSYELFSLRYHRSGSSKHKCCWFGRKVFLNWPMLNQLPAGAKSVLVRMAFIALCPSRIPHQTTSRDDFFSCEHQLYTIDNICGMCLKIRNPHKIPIQKQCFERKKMSLREMLGFEFGFHFSSPFHKSRRLFWEPFFFESLAKCLLKVSTTVTWTEPISKTKGHFPRFDLDIGSKIKKQPRILHTKPWLEPNFAVEAFCFWF